MNMKIRLFLGLIIFGMCIFILNDAKAEVPQQPSDVYVEGNQLMVRKRLPDGSLEEPKIYLIKGVTWAPTTRAPKEGPNSLDPEGLDPNIPDTVPYTVFSLIG
jgi:hypothetical protein